MDVEWGDNIYMSIADLLRALADKWGDWYYGLA